MNRILQFLYAITNALHIYPRPAKFLAFLQTVEPIIHYCLSGQQSYTHGPLADTDVLSSENSNFKYHPEGQSSSFSLWYCLGTCLIT